MGLAGLALLGEEGTGLWKGVGYQRKDAGQREKGALKRRLDIEGLRMSVKSTFHRFLTAFVQANSRLLSESEGGLGASLSGSVYLPCGELCGVSASGLDSLAPMDCALNITRRVSLPFLC